MDDKRLITVVTYERIQPKPVYESDNRPNDVARYFTAVARDIEHSVKESVLGMNIVAVIEGELCKRGKCKWCDDLRNRCASRRLDHD